MKSLAPGDAFDPATMSPPSRGAWIEIKVAELGQRDACVAPLAGGVD